MEHRTNPYPVHEDALVERCVNALLDLERRFGTRVLELSIDCLRADDDYGPRGRGAVIERDNRAEAFARAVVGARVDEWTPLPVAESLPVSVGELTQRAGSDLETLADSIGVLGDVSDAR